MKIELDLWFDDWLRIIESCVAAAEEKPSLLVALRVQKCWAEMMLNSPCPPRKEQYSSQPKQVPAVISGSSLSIQTSISPN
ncbi:hypothetical protein ACN42_g2172 [Penicillium freii]|uniref:Uncharacterized protein n=1 Tax=Penicillium freii TaxID=48697 RepID=A0A101MQQ5_PENFR|nr:hypothetical protein ACN42_g2172 [Penicillium freii]